MSDPPAVQGGGPPLSVEEREELVRSRMRGKRCRTTEEGLFDSLEAIVAEKHKVVPEFHILPPSPPPAEPQKLSYRDKVRNVQANPETWKDWSDSEDDEELLEPITVPEIPMKECRGPNVVFSKEEKEEMWKPWRKTLIIKPMHHAIGYKVLSTRARSLWKIEGEFRIMDLGFSCFIFRLSKKSDYRRMLMEGPWSIGGYAISVRRWSPTFKPEKDVVDRVTTWVRFPQLPAWCYTELGLRRVGSLLGRVLKVDYDTKFACRGRFARLCVELDLTQPLLGIIYVEGDGHKVEYEGLDVICFKCGMYGHRKDTCSQGQDNGKNEMEATPTTNPFAGTPTPVTTQPLVEVAAPPQEEDPDRGDWMVVQKRNRGNQRPFKEINHDRQADQATKSVHVQGEANPNIAFLNATSSMDATKSLESHDQATSQSGEVAMAMDGIEAA